MVTPTSGTPGRSTRSSSRRGLALLLVLATLIVVVITCTTLARQVTTIQLAHTTETSLVIATDLFPAANSAITAWLEKVSENVMLSPDVSSPRVEVFHSEFEYQGRSCRLGISAFDQLGMVPVQIARTGSPLRGTLSPDARSLLDQRMPSKQSAIPGLDLFVQSSPRRRLVFPHALQDEHNPPYSHLDQLALGELVATHNTTPAAINVNTAPLALLEAAARLAGHRDVTSIIDARSAKTPASAPHGSLPASQRATGVQLVSRSDIWAFCIDISVDHIVKSWWVVYQQRDGGWAKAQQLLITE